ncbi:hypothetical protein MM221_06155 [Salipaludibacillus sp. LMS25]|uniref:hypothetical protein n=1 Tax=Salipaludibacillus sp. LMS25 TaxID=2924031 RepID=UPI0020D1CEB1|nr:hypothetical protein [Salipaludibacillus sp. LMS25]UTR16139.1 hypothetical protein MM221_06155 [Salipaludibacillus sp. LMS25]
MTRENTTEINSKNTTDADLVELSGLHVYLEYSESEVIKVNEKSFYVEHSNFNEEKSGMDAMTVQNVASGEYHVVYMGTNADGKYGMADLITDIQLLTEATPQQLKDADRYLADMEKEFGEITSLGGNSLGGALANDVGVQNNHVRSVTLNPAMLPAGAIEAGKEYLEPDVESSIKVSEKSLKLWTPSPKKKGYWSMFCDFIPIKKQVYVSFFETKDTLLISCF